MSFDVDETYVERLPLMDGMLNLVIYVIVVLNGFSGVAHYLALFLIQSVKYAFTTAQNDDGGECFGVGGGEMGCVI